MVEALRESTTLKFVTAMWLLVTWSFIESQFGEEPIGILEYVQAGSLALAIWLGREWKEVYKGKGS